jgi:hypothetical protein
MVIYGKARQRKIQKVQPDEIKFEKKVMAESKPMHGSYELLEEKNSIKKDKQGETIYDTQKEYNTFKLDIHRKY